MGLDVFDRLGHPPVRGRLAQEIDNSALRDHRAEPMPAFSSLSGAVRRRAKYDPDLPGASAGIIARLLSMIPQRATKADHSRRHEWTDLLNLAGYPVADRVLAKQRAVQAMAGRW